MQAKNFGPELLSLHPNRGHGTPELALGNSPSSRFVSHKIKLKETNQKNGRVSHNIRNLESHKAVPAIVREYARMRVKLFRHPRPNVGLVSAAKRRSISAEALENKINKQVYK